MAKNQKQTIVDYRITQSEETHSEWILEKIKAQHPKAIFDLDGWDRIIDWETIEKQVEHIDTLATYMEEHDLPPLLYKTYLDLLHTSLQVLRDVFFVNTGFYLDIDNPAKIEEQDDFKKLRFWLLRDIEVTRRVFTVFERLFHYHKIQSLDSHMICDYVDGAWDSVEIKLRGIDSDEEVKRVIGEQKFRSIKSWCMTYAYSPYENREGVDSISTVSQSLEVSRYIGEFFQLFFQLAYIYQIEEDSLTELIDELTHSEYGEFRLGGWRKDMNVSKEVFINKLETDNELKPLVRDVVAVLEGKRSVRSLFNDGSFPPQVDISKCSNLLNWINIIVIAALLNEYEEKQKIVNQLKPYFYNDEDKARKFYGQIDGLEPTMITSFVMKLVKYEHYPEVLKSKSFWQVLHNNKLYPNSYPNWNDQLK